MAGRKQQKQLDSSTALGAGSSLRQKNILANKTKEKPKLTLEEAKRSKNWGTLGQQYISDATSGKSYRKLNELKRKMQW